MEHQCASLDRHQLEVVVLSGLSHTADTWKHRDDVRAVRSHDDWAHNCENVG